jgi:hypothetical protein
MFLASKGSDAVCEIVPGRGHGNLYQPHETYSPAQGREVAR